MSAPYAGILGLVAFVVSLIRGVIEGGSAGQTAWTAGICLWLFAIVGYLAGCVAEQALWESVKSRFEAEMQARESRKTGTRSQPT